MSASRLATKDRLHKRGRKVTNPFPNRQIQLMHPYKIDPLILSCTIYYRERKWQLLNIIGMMMIIMKQLKFKIGGKYVFIPAFSCLEIEQRADILSWLCLVGTLDCYKGIWMLSPWLDHHIHQQHAIVPSGIRISMRSKFHTDAKQWLTT